MSTTTPAAPYPVRVEAEIDHGLSRELWLAKWILVIPLYVVLLFLGIAFTVMSLIAIVAILITGRYPRGIFAFNVGPGHRRPGRDPGGRDVADAPGAGALGHHHDGGGSA